MALNENSSDFLQFADERPTRSVIDYKRLVFRALKYWYLVILSLAIALLASYLINRYTTKVYTVKASILIKESDENVEGKLLYNNVLVDPYRNFYNELYIIKSLPLVKEVVEDLGFTTQLIRQGDIKTTEYYNNAFPVNINIIPHSNEPYGKSLIFKIVNDNQYSLKLIEGNDELKSFDKLNFNDSVLVNGYSIVVKPNGFLLDEFKNKEFIISFQSAERIAGNYISRLSTSWQEQGASVVNLEINGPTVQKELDFLSKLIERYQYYDLEKKNQAASRTIQFIDEQLLIISDSLKYFEGQVEAFKQKNSAINLEGESLRLYERVKSLEANLATFKLQKNYYKYLTDYLKNDDNLDQIVPPTAVGVNDPIMTDLITQLVKLQMEVKLQTSGNLEESPLIVRKRRQIDETRKDLLESVQSTLEAQQINENFITQQIKLVDNQLRKLPESERKLVSIQRNFNLSENLYIFLMQKRAEAGISKAATTSDIIVVNPPRQMGGFITPKPTQNYSIAVFVGLAFPLLIFVIMEVLNNRVQSKEDIDSITNIPMIGGIGHNTYENNLVVHNKSKSSVAESFRSLRSNLNYFTQGKDKKIFMVTSSISGEGKTFTTINLATVLALSNKKVLIVGADMRKPKIFDDFNLTNEIGISNYLSGQLSFDDVVQKTFISNLYLVSGGPIPPNPSELLMSAKMEGFIKEALVKFDFVILDTPPIGLVTDAYILSKYADHILFLVRQNYTPDQAIKTIDELHRQEKIKNISILFNDIKKVGPGYGYGYSYSYGYGYGYGYGSKRGNGGGYYLED